MFFIMIHLETRCLKYFTMALFICIYLQKRCFRYFALDLRFQMTVNFLSMSSTCNLLLNLISLNLTLCVIHFHVFVQGPSLISLRWLPVWVSKPLVGTGFLMVLKIGHFRTLSAIVSMMDLKWWALKPC